MTYHGVLRQVVQGKRVNDRNSGIFIEQQSEYYCERR